MEKLIWNAVGSESDFGPEMPVEKFRRSGSCILVINYHY